MPALRDPLLPADVDLTRMEYMPLYIDRLKRSRAMLLAQTDPAAGFAMRLLWEESWGELPAGSLENDDLMLAAVARCTRSEWEDRRKIALHGWVACNDGRLYHPYICEIAWRVWLDRLKMLYDRERDRISKANKRHHGAADRAGQIHHQADIEAVPDYDVWVTTKYPATAARLAIEVKKAGTAFASMSVDTGVSAGQEKVVPLTRPNVVRKEAPCPPESTLKDKDKDKRKDNIIPPAPLCRKAGTSKEKEGEEWKRAADFEAFLEAVGQPDAGRATCWQAWREVVQTLPERKILLARVAAWREFCADQGENYRPLGPARLLKEGTLENFKMQADALLERDTAYLSFKAKDQLLTEIWGDLGERVASVIEREMFVAWFFDATPEYDGKTLIIYTPNAMRRKWIEDHFSQRIQRSLGCEVQVRLLEVPKTSNK